MFLITLSICTYKVYAELLIWGYNFDIKCERVCRFSLYQNTIWRAFYAILSSCHFRLKAALSSWHFCIIGFCFYRSGLKDQITEDYLSNGWLSPMTNNHRHNKPILFNLKPTKSISPIIEVWHLYGGWLGERHYNAIKASI